MGPSVLTRTGMRQLRVIPQSKNPFLCPFKRMLYGCWPYLTWMHELKNVVFFVSSTQMSNRKWRRRWCTVRRIVDSVPAAYCLVGHAATLFSTCPSSSSANFSTTTDPGPPCLHNECSQSDYSCTILLSVIIRQELKLKTFVSYFFNTAISMSPWWP